jgi:hypothetical protein
MGGKTKKQEICRPCRHSTYLAFHISASPSSSIYIRDVQTSAICITVFYVWRKPWKNNIKKWGKVKGNKGRAIAQAVSLWLPTAVARVRARGLVKWDLWWTKWRWGRFSPSTSVSPANLHSTNFSIILITIGTIGHSVADVPRGPSLDSPSTMQIKKKRYKVNLSLCLIN